MPGSPLTGASGGPRTSPLLRYLGAVRRVKWLVLLLTLVGLGGGYLVSRLRPPSFVVRAKLQIAPSESPTFQSDQWREYIQSYAVIEPVVKARRLYITGPKRVGGPPLPQGPSGPNAGLFNGFDIGANYRPGNYRFKVSEDGKRWELSDIVTSQKEQGVAGDSAGRAFGFQWLPLIERRWYGQTFDFTAVTTHEAADKVISNLTVTVVPPRNPRFITLVFTGQESEPTAGTLNDIMAQFVQGAALTKRHDFTIAARALDSQLVEAQGKLDADDATLQRFQIQTITLPRQDLAVAPGLQSTTPGAYAEFLNKRNEVETLRKERRDLASALTRLQRGDTAVADAYALNPVTKLSPELMSYVNELMADELRYRQNKGRYTDSMVTPDGKINMPRDVQDIHRLRTVTIPTYTRADLTLLDSMIARGDSEIGIQKGELHDIPQRSIEESELQRRKSVDESVVADLTKQVYAARAREATAVPDVAVLDAADAPFQPQKNRASLMIILGAIVGLGAGLGLALLLDMTDKRVRYADQITSGLGLTILGVIPEIRRAKGEQPSAEEAAQVIESFRTVRLNLAHALGEGSVMLTISSPSPGDGKSLVSSNLALSFAESGYRTLLIDGDSRRGELHRTFGAERRPGLLDYLAGELPMRDLLRPTSHPKLQLITGGSRKRNAPELLGTNRMRELLAAMREQFEVIVVDTPPLGAGIDPFVLGTLTGNLVLVLRAGATERDLAEAKLQIVDQLPIRLIGAVLNDVRSTMNDYKYYSYSYGYGATDEPTERPSLPATSGATPIP
ncbi:MAG TPA: polysaccharide biosynthesis tyrosine autokinase [Gemmatimonadales bacterium]